MSTQYVTAPQHISPSTTRSKLKHRNLLLTFFAGVGLQILAGVGLFFWNRSEWLTLATSHYPDGWEGYTLFDFFALLVFILFSICGFCLMYTVTQLTLRHLASESKGRKHNVVIAGISVYLIAIACFGVYWSWDMLPCGIAFCIDTDKHQWPPSEGTKPEAALGWKMTTGFPMLITSIALLLTLLSSKYEHSKNAVYHRNHGTFFNYFAKFTTYDEPLLLSSNLEEHPIPRNPMQKRYTPSNIHLLTQSKDYISMTDSSDIQKRSQKCGKMWAWLALFALFLFAFFFVATWYPNNWEYYYPAVIARKAAMKVPPHGEENLCQDDWKHYTCPEHDEVTMFYTRTIELTSHWILKLYPSNIIFYVFVFFFFFMGVFINTIDNQFTRYFQKKIRVPQPWNSTPRDRVAFFTVAELSGLLLCIVSAYLFFHYWFFDHNYNGYFPYSEYSQPPHISERLSRSLGQLGVFFFALLMFPAARNSPLLAMIGISWEASIQYHRWLGAAFFFAVMGHMFCTYWWYLAKGSWKDIYQIPMHLPTSIDNFTVPVIQLLVWTSIISIGVMGIIWQQFRRKHFSIFMFFHHFTYLTLIPAILWHAQASWEYILPAVTIWFADRMVRMYRSVRAVNLITALQASTSTGERYHQVNMFNPNSIDPRVITPVPIYTIHDHTNYQQERLFFQPFNVGTNASNSTTVDINGECNINSTRYNPPSQSQITTSTSSTELTATTTGGSSNQLQGFAPSTAAPEPELIPISPSFVHSLSSLTTGQNDPIRNSNTGLLSSSSQVKQHNTSSILNVSGPGVRIVDRGEAGSYIELRILNDNMVYFPGHYAFINIAEISLFEWHPFTIASPAHFCARSEVVFVIKTMGKNTWTQSLYDYVKDYYTLVDASLDDFIDVPLTVSLDGPYGTPIDFTTYDIVILLGGGIGVTPCKSIYESLLLSYLHDFKSRLMYQHTIQQLQNSQSGNYPASPQHRPLSEPNTNAIILQTTQSITTLPLVETNKRVHLMWSARDPTLFELMSESLSQVPYGPFSAQLFCDNPALKEIQDAAMHDGSTQKGEDLAVSQTTQSVYDLKADVDEQLITKNKKALDPHVLSLIRPGRPKLEDEFINIVEGLNPNSYLSGCYDEDDNNNASANSTQSKTSQPRSAGPVDPTSNHHGGFVDDNKKRVLVFACGPDAMSKDAEDICQRHGWDFHTETFAL